MIRYWAKLMKSSDSFLPKKMTLYRILKHDADSGNSYNGINYIKSVLDNIGLVTTGRNRYRVFAVSIAITKHDTLILTIQID